MPGRGAAVVALLLVASCLGAGCWPSPSRPNVVLISLDTLAPRRMSTYGGPRTNTPAIDALAARGIVFERAYSPAPWTLPAHQSMLSGNYPYRRGRGSSRIPVELGLAGYRTAAIVGGGFMSSDYGFDVGFSQFDEGGIDEAIGWIDSTDSEPFFLFFHTFYVHAPYTDRRYVRDLNSGRLAEETAWQLEKNLRSGEFTPTEAERDYVLGLYDGGIAGADAMVARIVDALERKGAMGRTIVIVTSDHGEEFWEHTTRGAAHGHSLYDELLHVPLVWYDPVVETTGGKVDQPVSLIDLAPTLASRLDLDWPWPVEGRDLTALLNGAVEKLERPLFGMEPHKGPRMHSVRTTDGKLILTQPEEGSQEPQHVELYAPDDITESSDRAAADPETTRKLIGLLEAQMWRETEPYEEQPLSDLRESTVERLRALGYLD